jgi:hypothetical protein
MSSSFIVPRNWTAEGDAVYRESKPLSWGTAVRWWGDIVINLMFTKLNIG